MKITICLMMINIMTSAQQYNFPTYDEYIAMFNKTYFDEDINISKANYEKNTDIMQDITLFTPEVNQFTDLSEANLAQIKSTKIRKNRTESMQVSRGKVGAPGSLDWRNQGIISPVKDQQICGNGWGMAPAAYFQARLRKDGNKGALVSDQFILECSGIQNSCNGGFVQDAMKTIIDGVPPQNWFPYFPYDSYQVFGICDSKDGALSLSKPIEYFYDLSDNEIINLLVLSPLVASVSSQNWEFYGSGIISCQTNSPVDHAVLLVGYTDQYWIAKNSWGKVWGQQGYIRILRGDNDCRVGQSIYKVQQQPEWQNKVTFLGILFCILALLL